MRAAGIEGEVVTQFVVNADGAGLRQLTPWGLAEDPGSWSPDGRWILFTKPGGKLYVVRPDGSGLQRIPLDTGPGRSSKAQASLKQPRSPWTAPRDRILPGATLARR